MRTEDHGVSNKVSKCGTTPYDIRELKGFRHVLRHAYDLTLRPDRLAELSRLAEQLVGDLPGWCSELGRKVRVEQDWNV
ncbi:MAG: hypothetical protein AABZ14_08200 [Candidatus Margulisiibacteriota bacterium]